MDRVKRAAAGGVLEAQATLLAHVKHQLWRARRVGADGLTEKEVNFLEKLEGDVEDCMKRCNLVNQKIHGRGKFSK